MGKELEEKEYTEHVMDDKKNIIESYECVKEINYISRLKVFPKEEPTIKNLSLQEQIDELREQVIKLSKDFIK